jgi:hypothetical protein
LNDDIFSHSLLNKSSHEKKRNLVELNDDVKIQIEYHEKRLLEELAEDLEDHNELPYVTRHTREET